MQKSPNIEKITFKVIQMKFLAMHITNQKLRFDTFSVGNVLNNFMEHDLNVLMIFGMQVVLLAIATHIHVLLVTGFVLQGHVCTCMCV